MLASPCVARLAALGSGKKKTKEENRTCPEKLEITLGISLE
jgi:hypothetical protein